ncbi:MAG TPA: hypothetical protein VGX97_08010 [bacterium]|nr:hypothetical protein [bacterium]
MLSFHVDELEATIVFPGGVAVELSLAGKSVDVRAFVGGRSALVRTDLDARPAVTIDIVERRGPEA